MRLIRGFAPPSPVFWRTLIGILTSGTQSNLQGPWRDCEGGI